jgi:DNA-binding helix-hairpin-helix protein with protein kinase domain
MDWTAHPGAVVVEEGGVRLTLAEPLARGGQGEVYTTENDGALVKIVTSTRGEIADRIRRVARFDVHDLPVVAPSRALEPPAIGYTMRQLTGMATIGSLGIPVSEPVPDDLASWHIATGGLRKRLKVLTVTADGLAVLHGRGFVYGDINARNVLVSAAPVDAETWIIDLDNLATTSERRRPVFTRDYAAPEHPSGRATQATDRFSLAVLVAAVLTARHPLAAIWRRPATLAPPHPEAWSHVAAWLDPDGAHNPAMGAPSPARMLSPRLRRLLREALVEGATRPERRPHAGDLAAALRSARLATTRCACGNDDYVTAGSCFRCGAPLGARVIEVYMSRPGGRALRYARSPLIAVDVGTPVLVERGALGLAGPRHEAVLEVTARDPTGVTLRSRCADEVSVSPRRLEVPGDVAQVRRRGRGALLLRLSGGVW